MNRRKACRAKASQARMRGFESRRPLQALLRPVSSSEAGLFCRHAWWALITDCLRKQGLASRSQIDTVVFPALSTELSEEQKRNKVKKPPRPAESRTGDSLRTQGRQSGMETRITGIRSIRLNPDLSGYLSLKKRITAVEAWFRIRQIIWVRTAANPRG